MFSLGNLQDLKSKGWLAIVRGENAGPALLLVSIAIVIAVASYMVRSG